jgi:AcrR family transcriptional regulator
MSSAAKQDYSRTAFTEEIIKDALLTLLKKKNYMDITITDICRQACISRGTFYSHFKNIREIIDLLFDDALKQIGNIPLQTLCHPLDNSNEGLPLCGFLRKNKRYQPLFFSDQLYIYAVQRTVASLRKGFLSVMKDKTDLDEDLLEDLLYYQIMGCMSICKRHINVSDDEWNRRKCNVDIFLKQGFGNLNTTKPKVTG